MDPGDLLIVQVYVVICSLYAAGTDITSKKKGGWNGAMQVNNLLLRVVGISETHGVRFPREFALLIKQLLYLDRYTRILAPELNWARDDRVDITMRSGTAY